MRYARPLSSPVLRGGLLLVLALSLGLTLPVSSALAQQQRTIAWPTSGWEKSTPAEQGMSPEPLTALHERIKSGDFGNVDRLVIVRHGRLVVSESYEHNYQQITAGRDLTPHQYNYNHPDWHPFFQGRPVHTLQSVTKSVTSILIGIAIKRGEISGVEATLLSFLGDYDLSRVDARLHDATLADLLTMRSGIEWHEQDRPLDATNTTIQLEAAADWVQFTLNQPQAAAPGEKWTYNSGGSQLMSAIIKQATGQTVDEYAKAHLFGPLGIEDFHWKLTPTGLPDTEGGLYLDAEQLAKLGYLYLHEGEWDGKQIVPAAWVRESVARKVDRVNNAGWGYGYQWWRLDRITSSGEAIPIWAGLGYGGQFLLVLPDRDVVVVINSWNIFGPTKANVLPAAIDGILEATK